jgi:serine phosphatase RsbU (regulator of sigma subunit)
VCKNPSAGQAGLFTEWDSPGGERRLFAGDTLALYTDAITEGFNDAREEFGEQHW